MKKSKHIIFFYFLLNLVFLSVSRSQPVYDWANKIGNTSTEEGYAIALDGSNNVYVMGKFYYTVDFDPGVTTYTLTAHTNGYPDIFFAKYTSAGNFVWAKNIGNPAAYFISCEDMTVDVAGNVFLCGNFDGTTDFNPDAGVNNLTSAGSSEIFYAKYNSNGSYVWAKSLSGAAGNDNAEAITLDASGNIYLTGYFSDVDFDPGAGVATLTPGLSYWPLYFAKYDLNGNYIWVKGIYSDNSGALTEDIHLDNSGNIYLAGQFTDVVDFDPGPGVSNITGSSSWNFFLGKYNSNGDYVWASGMGSTGSDNAKSIVTDANSNVWVGGEFQGTVDFNPAAGTNTVTAAGGTDAFLGKYDSNGNYIFAGNIGSSSADWVNEIIIDASGNIFATGLYSNNADFDLGAGTFPLPAIGALDFFMAKYNSSGNYLWTKGVGSSGNDQGFGLALNPTGYLHLTGYFNNTADFDPNIGVANLTSAGSEDAFFAKYYLCENFSASINSSNVTCNAGTDGSASAIPLGGSVPYTFLWNTTATTQSITGLSSGNYSVVVTSSEGCTATQTVLITQAPPVSANTLVTNVTCNGGNNGSITVNVTVGVSPFTYQWDASAGSQTTQTATGLSMGTYSVTVTDADGCTGIFSATVNQPSVLTSTITPTSVVCNGGSNGSAALSVSGGTPAYTFSWSTGASTQNISNLLSATYTVTITDNNGCIKIDSVFINQPPVLNPTITKIDVTCNGLCNGTATANVTGGTPPYVYQWLTSPNQFTSTATGLCPGVYNLIITDNNNCNVVPNVTITQPNTLTVSISVIGATCNNSVGSTTANVSGGTMPYTYNWSNGDSNQTANNLAAGNYSITVIDSNGCSSSAADTVLVVSLPLPICMVTVDSFSIHNQILWEKPLNLPIDSFRIYREVASVFTPFVTLPYSTLSYYTDTSQGINPNFTAYRYKISAIDSCGNESVLSADHKTIHLAVVPTIPCGYTLFWNDYIGFTITQYRIMRDTTNTGNFQAIDSVSFGNTSWTDTTCFSPTDTVTYVLEIDHPIGCVATLKNPQPMVTNLNSSRSNNYKVTDSSVVSINNINEEFIASAFPNPSNGIFTLEIKNRHNGGEVKIFNMLGEEIKRSVIATQSHKIQLDMIGFSKGVYHLQVRSGNGVINKKIIIQ